jgi:site-specific recombinase XerD
MKVQKVFINPYEECWLVLDDEYQAIKPITEFIKYLRNVDKSPYTIKSYAHSLKLYWEFLAYNEIDWIQINIGVLAKFISWLRTRKNEKNIIDLSQLRIERHNSSINAILGCLSSFYRYHNQIGNTEFSLTEAVRLPGNRFKSLLHHVFKDKPVQRRIINVKQPNNLPKTINKTQFTQLGDACTNYRDKFLLLLLYETGIRIGQALALRHDDVICWDNEIHIKYRTDNLNKVRGKTLKPNIIAVSNTLMNLYSDYISTLDQNRLTEYVFINFTDYKPLEYSLVKKLFTILSKKCGFYVRPHMLRHSHASELLKSGWEMALIQKRLGHASIQTTIDTYTHIDTKQMKEAFQQYLLAKEEGK